MTDDPGRVPYARMEENERRSRVAFDGLLRAFRPSVVCDVGALNGEETMRFAALVPDSKIVAFEANEENIQQFWYGNSRWMMLDNVHYEHLAVAAAPGRVRFNILECDRENPSDWRRGSGSLMERGKTLPHRTVIVESTSLDAYFPRALEQTFALWIDVEGALDQVLEGAADVLLRTVLLRVEVEHTQIWRGQILAPEIAAYLESLGFVCVIDTYVERAYDQSDMVFVRRGALDLLVPAPSASASGNFRS